MVSMAKTSNETRVNGKTCMFGIAKVFINRFLDPLPMANSFSLVNANGIICTTYGPINTDEELIPGTIYIVNTSRYIYCTCKLLG